MHYRAELRQLRLDVEQTRLDWEVTDQNLLPKFDFVGSGNTGGLGRQISDALKPATEFRSAGYSLGFLFEVPLGNHTFRGAERRARNFYQLSLRALRDREHAVAAEVRDAVRNVNFFASRVRTTRRAREVSERQLAAEQRRLAEGASTNFEVLTFQRALAQALTLERGAMFEYAKAVTKLRLVQGLDWEGRTPEWASHEAMPAELPDEWPEADGLPSNLMDAAPGPPTGDEAAGFDHGVGTENEDPPDPEEFIDPPAEQPEGDGNG